MRLTIAASFAFAGALLGQGPESVLVVVNRASAISREIGEYYVRRRAIPLGNLYSVAMPAGEQISREGYRQRVAAPLAAFLKSRHLQEQILYIVTTTGVPLRVLGTTAGPGSDAASVDSELTLLYSEMKGLKHPLNGYVPNPYYGAADSFTHPRFPIYLVTRLTGYDFQDVKAIVDRALAAQNTGNFVIDLKSSTREQGNDWLADAARKLPAERVLLDESARVLHNEANVIGYAGWGSNDPNRSRRHLGFHWLPGAIMTEFVSTNARTFTRPPDSWTLGNWNDQKGWFFGSPQTMTADYIHDGVTGASGHVDEPYLALTPRPDLLLPAYFRGRNLAQSYYAAIPGLSWMNIVVGDPLCSLGRPR